MTSAPRLTRSPARCGFSAATPSLRRLNRRRPRSRLNRRARSLLRSLNSTRSALFTANSCRPLTWDESPPAPSRTPSSNMSARPSAPASTRSTRTASARLSTDSSSALSTAMSTLNSRTPRRSCARARRFRARRIIPATAFAATFRRFAATSAAPRFCSRAVIRSSWPSCFRRRCPRSTTASSR